MNGPSSLGDWASLFPYLRFVHFKEMFNVPSPIPCRKYCMLSMTLSGWNEIDGSVRWANLTAYKASAYPFSQNVGYVFYDDKVMCGAGLHVVGFHNWLVELVTGFSLRCKSSGDEQDWAPIRWQTKSLFTSIKRNLRSCHIHGARPYIDPGVETTFPKTERSQSATLSDVDLEYLINVASIAFF